jgi:hypothetical protein
VAPVPAYFVDDGDAAIRRHLPVGLAIGGVGLGK